MGAEAVLVNCVPAVEALASVRLLRSSTARPIGVYPNIGHAHDVDGWRFDLMLPPDRFASILLECLEAGASILGGCCGTQPEHLAALAAALSAAP
jgi:S-methylmethionine-dependent homocysteine/selenocysteine methylase